MYKEMISIGLGILAAIVPVFLPNLSAAIGYALLGVAAILVLLGAFGLRRKSRLATAKNGNINIFHVTIEK